MLNTVLNLVGLTLKSKIRWTVVPEGIHSRLLMKHVLSVCFDSCPVCPVSLSSFTELTFTWIFNEYPSFVIQDTRRFVSQKTGNLFIAKVESSDVGNYTCVVTNTVTQSSVQGPPTPLVLRVDGIRAWHFRVQRQTADLFLFRGSSRTFIKPTEWL